MTLPQVGTKVNYCYATGQTTPALVQFVDDINNLVMVSYISPTPPSSLSFPGAPVLTSPWATQGSNVGQWS